jgi:hypothetical protein
MRLGAPAAAVFVALLCVYQEALPQQRSGFSGTKRKKEASANTGGMVTEA